MCFFVSYFWLLFGTILVAAVVLFVLMAAKKITMLAPVGGALLALCGMLFGVYQYLEPKCLPAKPTITDQIIELESSGFHDIKIIVTNNGKAIARNCRMEIEYRDTEQEKYSYLGSAPLQPENLNPGVEIDFWLVEARSYKGEPWEVWIMGKGSSYPPIFTGAGEHELRLTIIAENAKSSPVEFKLTIYEDPNKPPTLKPLR
jgi:hypothetical protein